MRPTLVKKLVVDPGLRLMAVPFDTVEAKFGLYAIGFQETGFDTRHQRGGPAHSYWQFERIGVEEVMVNRGSKLSAQMFCEELDIPFDLDTVWKAIEWNSHLACVFARLALWRHPAALPDVNNIEAWWEYYIDIWRPGKPHRGRS